MQSQLFGLFLGIISSLIAWWILFHALKPAIYAIRIFKCKSNDYRNGYKYFVQLQNLGNRSAIDINPVIRLRFKGLSEKESSIWSLVDLPLRSPKVVEIKKGKWSFVPFDPNASESFDTRFPDHIQLKSKNNELLLEDLLNLPNEVDMEIYVFSYDKFSGSRSLSKTSLSVFDIEETASLSHLSQNFTTDKPIIIARIIYYLSFLKIIIKKNLNINNSQ